MISSDIRIQGFDSRAFTNLISLFAPNVVWRRERDPSASDAPEVEEAAAPKPDGMLIVVLSPKDTVRVAFHTVKGRVRDFHFPPAPSTQNTSSRPCLNPLICRAVVLPKVSGPNLRATV